VSEIQEDDSQGVPSCLTAIVKLFTFKFAALMTVLSTLIAMKLPLNIEDNFIGE
jgi:hypothetical protein